MMMKKSLFSKLGGVQKGANVAGRLAKTARVASSSLFKIAKGVPPDAHLLKDSFEKMGVTYIKLGQFIASSPSVFPKEYVSAFADCLDQTTPIDFELVKQVLTDELGNLSAFASIDPIPLASASIAQVHKAVLQDGRQVALKVQKPNVKTVIDTDLSVLYATFWALEKALPSLKMASLSPMIDEIKKRMADETDFIAESHNLLEFEAFLKNTNNTHITAPDVIDALTSKKVLTMSLLTGVSLVDESLIYKINHGANPATIMGWVLDTWFLQLMTTGKFHADLHAGNLMYLTDGRVGFLDFGLVGQIDPKSLHACFSLVQGLQSQNYQLMAEAMVDIGMTKPDIDIKNQLACDLKNLLTAHTDSTSESLNAFMAQMAHIGKKHGIHFPKDFALLTKQLLYFDRFMMILAPDMDMFGERINKTDPLSSTPLIKH